MQRAGQLNADGSAAPRDRKQATQRVKEPRTSIPQFIREVIAELKKVAWPTRAETIRLSIIVFIAIVVLTAFIFGVDYLFEHFTGALFKTPASTSTASSVAPLLGSWI